MIFFLFSIFASEGYTEININNIFFTFIIVDWKKSVFI